jgi:hypothetical protein
MRLAGVQPHANGDVAPVRPLVIAKSALRVDRRGHCVAGPHEGEKERVALCVDLGPAVRGERFAHESPVVA